MELQLPLWLSLPLAAFLWCGVLIVLLSFMKARTRYCLLASQVW